MKYRIAAIGLLAVMVLTGCNNNQTEKSTVEWQGHVTGIANTFFYIDKTDEVMMVDSERREAVDTGIQATSVLGVGDYLIVTNDEEKTCYALYQGGTLEALEADDLDSCLKAIYDSEQIKHLYEVDSPIACTFENEDGYYAFDDTSDRLENLGNNYECCIFNSEGNLYVSENQEWTIRTLMDEKGSQETDNLNLLNSGATILDAACFGESIAVLREDGTVDITDEKDEWTADWNDITAISANLYCLMGLCEDGTVKVVFDHSSTTPDAEESWSDIRYVYAGNGVIAACGQDTIHVLFNDQSAELEIAY